MVNIALVLALVEKKTNDNLDLIEYVVDADECDQQPYEERDKATSPQSKVGEQSLQSPARTNQIGHVKGVRRTHASKSLVMAIPWSGKGKRPHTMWMFEYRKVSCLYMLIELSSPRKVKYRCKCCDVLHECIEMSACDIMID